MAGLFGLVQQFVVANGFGLANFVTQGQCLLIFGKNLEHTPQIAIGLGKIPLFQSGPAASQIGCNLFFDVGIESFDPGLGVRIGWF